MGTTDKALPTWIWVLGFRLALLGSSGVWLCQRDTSVWPAWAYGHASPGGGSARSNCSCSLPVRALPV